MGFWAEKIQQAWQKQSKWLVLLRPLSCLYRMVFLWQKQYKQKYAYTAPIPVMVIGNITVGGSGKTPLIIALIQYLQQHHIAVGVISRGYGGKGKFPALVTADSLASQVGDEPVLIVQQTHVAMAVGANRQQSIQLLLTHYPDLQLILSDDGLQHFALNRDLEWVVVDSQRGFGNQKLLPEGFLREPIERLQQVTVIEHHANAQHDLNMHLSADQPFCLGATTQAMDKTKTYHAVVGIGYPQRFFATLQQLNIKFHPHIFADHHHYKKSDFEQLADQLIVTTAKDAVKLSELWHDCPAMLEKIWVIPVKAQLSPACYTTLHHQLQTLNILI